MNVKVNETPIVKTKRYFSIAKKETRFHMAERKAIITIFTIYILSKYILFPYVIKHTY